MNSLDLSSLNGVQKEAVQYGDGPLLILAGAGSGKTRVLTYRVAYLIQERGVSPSQIFAVTFTNKAASEMKHRLQQLLFGPSAASFSSFPFSTHSLWVQTFHSACVRILRSEISVLGYQPSFVIYDDSDQISAIRASMRAVNVSEKAFSPKSIQSRINRIKNDGFDHTNNQSNSNFGYVDPIFQKIFTHYAESLQAASALDFADLILLVVTLFKKFPEVLAQYQKRFPYVLVDEYQDTNHCQYEFMKLLAGTNGNVCAVGDEDQSIYRWRGANISNILNFEKDYPNAKIFILEENYRSTKNIIEAASHVVSYNTERRNKNLFTQNSPGEKICIFECYDEYDEATKTVEEVAKKISEGVDPAQIAIFYRTNAQSRLFEDLLRVKAIPYQIYGGLKFYDRLEVKDLLAYLKLLSNPDDNASFRRIINTPARGIGGVTIEKLSELAEANRVSLYQCLAKGFAGEIDLSSLDRAKTKLHSFFKMMEMGREKKDALLPSDLFHFVLEESGYQASLAKENSIEANSRLENLAELRKTIVEYELRNGGEDPSRPLSLSGFLEEIVLVNDLDRKDLEVSALKMMTIHMAKGLEFDSIFLVGLEEELFPSFRPMQPIDPSAMEEERRLFYVGMTRARKTLALFFARNRTVFGFSYARVRSRFLDEIPESYLNLDSPSWEGARRTLRERKRFSSFRERDQEGDFLSSLDSDFSQIPLEQKGEREPQEEREEKTGEAFKAGKKILHPIFGEGVIRKKLGEDKIMVEFAGRGIKKISLQFAQLKGM